MAPPSGDKSELPIQKKKVRTYNVPLRMCTSGCLSSGSLKKM